MATDTSKITGAADDLADKLTKGGSAAKTLGAEIVSAFNSLDTRVAALETGSTPPTPTPPNTKGLIENFSPANAARFKVGGLEWANQNANKAHCIRQIDEYTLQMEVRQNDQWTYDSSSNNRNEVSVQQQWPEPTEFTMEFTFTLHEGPRNSSGFLDITQCHAITDVPPSPFYLNLMTNDCLQVVLQKPKGSSYDNIYPWTGTTSIRGKTLAIRNVVRMGPSGNGYAKVWIDGEQVLDYRGAFGATGSDYYWKFGLYRSNVADTQIATFRNVQLTCN